MPVPTREYFLHHGKHIFFLLKQLKKAGPLTIFALAKLLERDYKNVHTDVSRLIDLKLVEKDSKSQVRVAWESVRAELKL